MKKTQKKPQTTSPELDTTTTTSKTREHGADEPTNLDIGEFQSMDGSADGKSVENDMQDRLLRIFVNRSMICTLSRTIALIAALICVTLGSTSPAEAQFVRGDANGDGHIDIADPSFILGYLYQGRPAPACEDAADFNDDGVVEITDAIALVGYLYEGSAPPAAPYPYAGYDLTPTDVWTCGDDPVRLVSGTDFTCAHHGTEIDCWGTPIGDALPDRPFIGVGAGPGHICADVGDTTTNDWSEPVCVGSPDNSDFRYEPLRGDYVASAGGDKHHCAIARSGSMRCWGMPSSFQAPGFVAHYGPSYSTYLGVIGRYPIGRYKTIASSNRHQCAIKVDGTLVCSGDHRYGAIDEPSGAFYDVAVGLSASCGIRTSGLVECWGWQHNQMVTEAPTAGSFASISARGRVACAIGTLDQAIHCWGAEDSPILVNVPDGTFRRVSVGGSHACAVANDDSVVCWGQENDA